MIIKMILRQVGEYGTAECQTCYTLLYSGVRRYFHKAVVAACTYHIGKQSIGFQYVGGGVDSLTLFEADIVSDSGD